LSFLSGSDRSDWSDQVDPIRNCFLANFKLFKPKFSPNQTKNGVFSLKTCIFVTSEEKKQLFLRNTKHRHFWYMQKYGNYCVIIGSKYSLKIWFGSNFNRIFDYVHGTHCLRSNVKANTSSRMQLFQCIPMIQLNLFADVSYVPWKLGQNSFPHLFKQIGKTSDLVEFHYFRITLFRIVVF